MLSTLTDLELVNEIRIGNVAAFRTFYYRHVDNIFGMVTRLMGPYRNDREDVVQEIFFQVSKSIPNFREQSGVSTWLHRIACNVTYSALRRPHYRKEADSDFKQVLHDVEGRIDARRTINRMYKVIDELSIKNRIVFTLYEFQGLTIDTISEILNIPLHTAASRLKRSREQIMETLCRHDNSMGKEES